MNNYFLLTQNKEIDQGFTLIELLVTVIIVGILAAISMPVLFANIGKARETEASSTLGAVIRAQHAHHFQFGSFAIDMESLLGRTPDSSGYYSYPDPTVATDALVKHQALTNVPWDRTSRNYAGGTYFDATNGIVETTICRASQIGATVEVGDAAADDCTNGGLKLR